MERLSFAEKGLYNGIEAAIHMARYAFVRSLCPGKTVLDMACGEGYGSRLLATWGAQRVVGVDVSGDAISQARRLFSGENIEFHCEAAETIGTVFAPGTFDLIVSLETIEHVENPMAMLRLFQDLLKHNGTIVISCPNDWWYYPAESEKNPFHLRKYTLDEFRAESERVLGQAKAWYWGTPMAGFCNVRLSEYLEVEADESQSAMLRATAPTDVMTLPSEVDSGPQASNASYFVGVWSTSDHIALTTVQGAAILPVSMDAFKDGFFAEAAESNRELRQQVETLERRLSALEQTQVWQIDDAPMLQGLLRAERLRWSLAANTPAQTGSDLQARQFSLLNRVADMEKSMLLAQLQRLRVLYESQGDLREQVRIARLTLDNERAAERAHYELLMSTMQPARESLERNQGTHSGWISLVTALQAQRETELEAARVQKSMRDETLQVQRQNELEAVRIQQNVLDIALQASREAQDEVANLRERLLQLNRHAESLQIYANRYTRMRDLVPASVRQILLAFIRRARRALASLH